MEAALRAIAEPRRRQILELVRDQELSAGAIASRFDVTRPAISQHLGVLKEAGLVDAWGWEGDNPVAPGSTTIEYELTPEGDGTRLRFVHSGLPSEESKTSHAHGWDHYFERLTVAAAGGELGPDPWLTGDMS